MQLQKFSEILVQISKFLPYFEQGGYIPDTLEKMVSGRDIVQSEEVDRVPITYDCKKGLESL